MQERDEQEDFEEELLGATDKKERTEENGGERSS